MGGNMESKGWLPHWAVVSKSYSKEKNGGIELTKATPLNVSVSPTFALSVMSLPVKPANVADGTDKSELERGGEDGVAEHCDMAVQPSHGTRCFSSQDGGKTLVSPG